MATDALPSSYSAARDRFRRAAELQGFAVTALPIAARGPDGEALTIDVVHLGAARPRRAFVTLSGVHGVEGFAGSLLQTDLLARLQPAGWPDDVAVLVVHVVNPWGMAWRRRQNESNVDLNRNWRRDHVEPPANPAYDELHPHACPDDPEPPAPEALLAAAVDLVTSRGLEFVRDGITVGQYRHPDGLHFGGDRTEESNRVLEHLVVDRLGGVERLFTMDLHTGHGPRGAVTCLSSAPPGSSQDRFLREAVGIDRVEATADNPDATTATKSGQIAGGFAAVLPHASCFATTVEFGTTSDEEQLVATCREQWVHRHGDRIAPEHVQIIDDYAANFAPPDPDWVATVRDAGARHLDAGLAAVMAWEA